MKTLAKAVSAILLLAGMCMAETYNHTGKIVLAGTRGDTYTYTTASGHMYMITCNGSDCQTGTGFVSFTILEDGRAINWSLQNAMDYAEKHGITPDPLWTLSLHVGTSDIGPELSFQYRVKESKSKSHSDAICLPASDKGEACYGYTEAK